MAKTHWLLRLLRKIGISVLKAIPVLPITLLNDWLWLKFFGQWGLSVNATLEGTILNIFINTTDIVVVLLYADLINIFGLKKRR